MIRPVLLALVSSFVLASVANAQPMDPNMPGMAMPKTPAKAKPAAKRKAPATPANPHAGHDMSTMPPAQPAMPKAGGETADPHAGHTMSTPAALGAAAESPHAGDEMPAEAAPAEEAIPQTPPPPPPTDHAADRDYDPAAMAAARTLLQHEHGDVRYSKVIAKLAEYQSRSGPDGYRWDGQASFGGDVNRLVFKSEGEGTRGEGVEAAELQALYSRAITPFWNLQAGVRQDFKPHDRTYATVGVEGLAPYWLDVEGALFVSTQGEVLARAEGTYDLRLTQRWILQPRAELNFAGQDTRATRTGSGLSNAELGLRLRYEIRREFAPYIGVSYDRRFGKTADYARAAGEDPEATSFVVGLRAWF
ncbi:copper resistance protein B [Phenylobacterium soli]|uniref:Copper resistance protein CopB n=1 Tax=Phenylobacterium soli TaxID=2170551 RepID=A0A328AJA8_9CAUL|nr:copper resistance protein B [Phenylobacterium soli]RAK54156.1 copper resistance protein CopB [Phenylobacterium soli]